MPIAELAPDMPHPETGQRMIDIAAHLVIRPAGDGQPSLCRRTDIKLDSFLGD